jgi:O-acetylserine/cysteine efflux transporter
VPTLVLVFLTAALMGGNYVALKEALAHTTPIALTAMRAGLGGLALGAFALARGERPPRSRPAWLVIGAVSTCVTTASSMLLVLGTKRVPSGVTALLSATMPLCAAGFGALVSPVMFVACQLLVSAIFVGSIALVVEGTGGVEPGWDLALPLGYSAIPAMAIPFSLIATVLRRAPAVQGAAVAYLIPLFGVLASWLVRGETLAVAELAGGALVIVGVVLVNRARR